MIYRTYSSAETKKIAAKLSKTYSRGALGGAAGQNKRAAVLALYGDLGSGKTTFGQGFLRALGVRKKITSPTFVLIRKYKLTNPHLKLPTTAFHIDAYRLKNPENVLALGFKEIISDPENIVLIEWPDRLGKFIPKTAHRIKFSHGAKVSDRIIETDL